MKDFDEEWQNKLMGEKLAGIIRGERLSFSLW